MSKFSKEPAFNSVAEPSPITEAVFRLIAIYEGAWFPQGACTVISGHLAITARHILLDFFEKWGVTTGPDGSPTSRFSLRAFQLLNNPIRYAIWDVDRCFVSPLTDIALVHLIPYCENAGKFAESKSWKQLRIDLLPPPVGSRIVGFGFHGSEAKMSKNADGSDHVELNDKPTATVGQVREIHLEKRDSVRLNFPCYRVNARFDGGMSGGPVLSDAGHMCGVICSSLPPADSTEEHASYVATLWPAMGIVMNINRGLQFPKDVFYPMWDLARSSLISAEGWERIVVEENPFPGMPGGSVYRVNLR